MRGRTILAVKHLGSKRDWVYRWTTTLLDDGEEEGRGGRYFVPADTRTEG